MKVTVVVGSEGHSLYFDDYRVAGPKPWGGGTVIDEWTVAESTDTRALDVERLAGALHATGALWSANDYYEATTDADEFAAAIAREYAALPPETGR